LLAEADRTLTAHQDAALLSDRTLNNYKQEYESLVLAYVDTNYAATSISRGESDSDTFREEITTLRALIETAEEAALEVSTQDTLLARKAVEIAEQLRHLPSVWPTVPDAQVHSTMAAASIRSSIITKSTMASISENTPVIRFMLPVREP
jgi:hypothetical protein